MWLFKRRSPSPSSYEKILDKISTKIRKSEGNIHSLRTSLRRITGLVTLYSLLLYTIFLAYIALAQKFKDPQALLHAIWAPLAIWLARRGLFEVYSRRIKRQEATLQVLRDDQKAKIEELKSSMKYYTTKSLVDRFEKNGASGQSKDKKAERNENRGRITQGELEPRVGVVGNAPSVMPDQGLLLSRLQVYPPQTVPQAPESPRWYDRILDVLVGEDETSPRNRYALICLRCGTHNGLAPPGQTPDSVSYRCPVCGEWNPEEVRSTSAGDDEMSEVREGPDEGIVESENEESPVAEAEEKLIETPTPIRQQPKRRAKKVNEPAEFEEDEPAETAKDK
ncbi:hypothetical protein POJ06DRAFT_242825 [Lipomyces tetrasporus]|uniref:Endoplasmic reticulum junction formation protein lunapark n=1 Tax=Lipomyces tetrasporus TaxID=54092 RepID=A0AAD7QYN1_9ASCO|nr:uncharacterized protein POJ06DRAFT_242825 [Lipomyces tetrasporus]KAJ8103801.1 hypothetical protein POJ06DRAFT_242825 [Lipomyces tetrasporus]